MLLLFAALLLAACSKINQANYDKIETGMSKQAVVELLGEPTQADTSNLLGLSAGQLKWQNGDQVITLTLLNDKVMSKSMAAHP